MRDVIVVILIEKGETMLKFKFNYQNNTLSYQHPPDPDIWYEITETFEGNFKSRGFQLSDGWITFTIYQNKITAFFRQWEFNSYLEAFSSQETAKYFKKDLPKQAEVIFSFTPPDEVEKVGSNWIKKGGLHD